MNKVLLVSALIILVILVIKAALFLVPRMKRYSKIFKVNHFYEIYNKMSEIKETAVKNIESETNLALPSKDDPRGLITDAGLAIFYTITTSDNKYEHHVSVSCYGHYTPHAVGEPFILYIADIMSWKIQDAVFFFTETPVYHAVVELNTEEQLAWEKRPIKKYEVESKDDLSERIQELRENVQFEQVFLHEKDGSRGM